MNYVNILTGAMAREVLDNLGETHYWGTPRQGLTLHGRKTAGGGYVFTGMFTVPESTHTLKAPLKQSIRYCRPGMSKQAVYRNACRAVFEARKLRTSRLYQEQAREAIDRVEHDKLKSLRWPTGEGTRLEAFADVQKAKWGTASYVDMTIEQCQEVIQWARAQTED